MKLKFWETTEPAEVRQPRKPRTPVRDGYAGEYGEIMNEAEWMHFEQGGLEGAIGTLVREIVELQARLERLEHAK